MFPVVVVDDDVAAAPESSIMSVTDAAPGPVIVALLTMTGTTAVPFIPNAGCVIMDDGKEGMNCSPAVTLLGYSL